MNLCDTIDYKLAKILNNRVFADTYGSKYAAEYVEVTYDNYLGVGKYKEGDFIEDGDYVHGKYYYAPTYAEVIDWLVNNEIYIEFMPAFTYSLNEHIAYYFFVYKKNEDEGKLNVIFEQLKEMSSFGLAMKDIVEKLINDKYID
mgnify:CR=1 FL=1